MDVETKKDDRRTVGRRLRRAREEQGLSLDEVEATIKVHAHHVKALEQGDYDALPSPLWARGFLISYADYLGLDGEYLAYKLLPRPRSSRPKRYFKRYWRALIAVLGTIGVALAMVLATIVVPYNPFTGWIGGTLEQIAPGVFLADGPQRVVLLGDAEVGITSSDNVLLAEVSEDGIDLRPIPRDTSTEIPGHGGGEIGDAFAIGGPDLTRRSVAQLTDTEVPYYCVIGTRGIREIVGSIGGVRVRVPQTTSGKSAPGRPVITLRPGSQILNANEALVYLQGNDLLNDEERTKRQQEFLYAMYRQALGPSNLLSNPSTLNAVLDSTETNMSGVQILQLVGRIKASEEGGRRAVGG